MLSGCFQTLPKKIPFKHRNRLKGTYLTYQSCLFLFKGRAGCSPAVAGAASLDVHMFRVAFVIGIVDTFHRFTINADGSAGMGYGTFKRIHPFPLLPEAVTAGFVAAAGMLSAHHDVSLAAEMLVIVGTIVYRTF